MFNVRRSMPVTMAIGGAAAVLSGLIFVPLSGDVANVGATPPPTPIATQSSCTFGNPSVHHVIQITFDNVHFNRDNPNVLSDIEQLPALRGFMENNGTLLSNNHTPLIAHTANDTITNYTGLYGDRNGIGVSNDYGLYSGPAATPPAANVSEYSSFNYWTAPSPSGNGSPAQPYSATSPATGGTTPPPAPWATFAGNGCDTAGVSTSNMELENVNPDISTVFGPTSKEQAQVTADTSSFKDQETNDYLGLGVHCANASAFCAGATAVKYGDTTPSPTAAPDQTGFQAVFGHKYLQPAIESTISSLSGATSTGTTSGGLVENLTSPSGYQISDAAGNLVDLSGNEIDGQYLHTAGFPGFGPITAAQSLAYTADLQESGVPVTYAYISDLHEKKFYPASAGAPSCSTAGVTTGGGLAPADPCYTFNAQQYNAAFTTFFNRLAADGITPANTEFVFTADEGDHFNGANVGRAVQPTCTGTPATTAYSCAYPSGSVGELSTDIHGLLNAQQSNSAAFYNEPQGNTVYVNGQPSATDPTTRALELAFASAHVRDPFVSSSADVPLTNFMADQKEEALLHYVVADPSRTPTFTVFPQSDVYMTNGTTDTCSGTTTAANAGTNCTFLSSRYLWNHGYYAPEINNTWLGLVGPGVDHLGLNGSDAAAGPNSAGASSGAAKLDTSVHNDGIWADHTDSRPTLMALVGLKDSYTSDGRVLTQIMSTPPATAQGSLFAALAGCYKQLNSSVGIFGTDTLIADTHALKGVSSQDNRYAGFLSSLTALGSRRDALAGAIKQELFGAEFNGQVVPTIKAALQLLECKSLLSAADQMAK
jgi:hypothetical protein